MIARSLFAAAFMLTAAHAAAAQTEPSKEVVVEADQMEIQEKENTAVFTGKVDAVRADVHMTCDKLIVYYEDAVQPDGSKKSEASRLDATGNVTIVTKTQRITGQAAKMDVKANKLTVTGNVRVVQGQTTLKGENLVVDLNTDRSQMTGGRVKGSFVPQ